MIRKLIILNAAIVAVASFAPADDYKPKVADASKDAELALQGFVLPEGMTGKLLASEPALANPVAFYAADDGRVYVCETFRQEVGVEDNRSHMDWLNNDLQLETVEERLAMFKKYLGSDVSRYATEHDRIRVLTDTNGDGRFDEDKVFAQGFNDILDGTGAGVIEHDGKVYYTCIPKLWMLEDSDGDGIADKTDALHHGYGVRVAQARQRVDVPAGGPHRVDDRPRAALHPAPPPVLDRATQHRSVVGQELQAERHAGLQCRALEGTEAEAVDRGDAGVVELAQAGAQVRGQSVALLGVPESAVQWLLGWRVSRECLDGGIRS